MIERKRKRTPDNSYEVPKLVVKRSRTDPKDRVYLLNTKHRITGTIIEQGAQQSRVKWDNGNETIVVNEWIAVETES